MLLTAPQTGPSLTVGVRRALGPSLLCVPLRVRHVPIPRHFHDRAQLRVLRRPAQLAADFVAAGDEHGRIAGATRHDTRRDRAPGDLARHVEHFLDAEAAAIAQIVGAAALVERAQRQDMRLRQVDDVDVCLLYTSRCV